MFRIASNPFFPYVLERIDERMGQMPTPVVKSAPRTHETAAGQLDGFPGDLNVLEPVGGEEP